MCLLDFGPLAESTERAGKASEDMVDCQLAIK
jgi:hypothetical protein